MFGNNWNLVIIVLVIVLILTYFGNCSEGFGGTTTNKVEVSLDNAEAIRNVASIYNKDEVKLTNLTATGSINLPRGAPINYADNDPKNFSIKYSNDGGMDGLMINSWNGGDFRTNAGGAKKIMWWNPVGVGMTDLYSNTINNGGKANLKDTEIRGRLDIYGPQGNNHLPWTDGVNYLRGKTQVDGQFCIGGTCITEGELANLKVAAKHFFSENNRDMFSTDGLFIPVWDCWGRKNMTFDNGCNLYDRYTLIKRA